MPIPPMVIPATPGADFLIKVLLELSIILIWFNNYVICYILTLILILLLSQEPVRWYSTGQAGLAFPNPVFCHQPGIVDIFR